MTVTVQSGFDKSAINPQPSKIRVGKTPFNARPSPTSKSERNRTYGLRCLLACASAVPVQSLTTGRQMVCSGVLVTVREFTFNRCLPNRPDR